MRKCTFYNDGSCREQANESGFCMQHLAEYNEAKRLRDIMQAQRDRINDPDVISLCSRCRNPSRFTLCHDCVKQYRLEQYEAALAKAFEAAREHDRRTPKRPKYDDTWTTKPDTEGAKEYGAVERYSHPMTQYEHCILPAPDSFIADLCNAIEGRDGIVRWGA